MASPSQVRERKPFCWLASSMEYFKGEPEYLALAPAFWGP